MRKFKVGNKDKEQLSDQEISKYKDFGKVVTNYEQAKNMIHKRPLYKDPRAFLALLVVLLIVYLVSESARDAQNPDAPEIEQIDSAE
ncbi:MAG: hypothetical protein HKN32_02845 [Flavobacteriales bacterium]|nr:hypothetical protein [Flavobacteriales bacterium]